MSNDEALGLVNFSAPLKSCHYDSTGASAKGTDFSQQDSAGHFCVHSDLTSSLFF